MNIEPIKIRILLNREVEANLKKYRGMNNLLDPILPKIFSKYIYDNTAYDFFAALPEKNISIKEMQSCYDDFVNNFDFKSGIKISKADECLGLAYVFLKKARRHLTGIENLEKIYPSIDAKSIHAEDKCEDDECYFKTTFTVGEYAIKISTYIAGCLSNSSLPYYHFVAVVRLVESKMNNKRDREYAYFIADPGEGMINLYSHFEKRDVGEERDGGFKTAHVTTFVSESKTEITKEDYFKWLESDPEMSSLAKTHGIFVEGEWRREQRVVVINKALTMKKINQYHGKLAYFLLFPKLVKFNERGKPISYILWNLLKRSVSLFFEGKSREFNFDGLRTFIEIEGRERGEYQKFLESWGDGAQQEMIKKKIAMIDRYADQFYCAIVKTNFLRKSEAKTIDKLVKEVGTSLENKSQELQQERLNKEIETLCFRKLDDQWVSPCFIKDKVNEELLNRIYKRLPKN